MYVVVDGDGRARAVADVSEAFVQLYRRSVVDVYSYLASRTTDRGVAEDLMQDVFVAGAVRAREGELVTVAWLIGTARHKLIDHWRRRDREERRLALLRGSRAELETDDLLVLEVGAASAALESLNPTYRAALVLRHVDELSVAEVAAQLGRTVEATEQVLTRARSAFRASYEESRHA